MKKSILKIWNILSTILIVCLIILAILLAGVRLIGLTPLSVLSGSMEPTYHVGSLIYVKDVDYTELEPGDVITFMIDEDTMATHRIVEVVPDDEDPSVLRFRTKGDANENVDGGLVHYKNIVGSPVFTIPMLGFLANFIQHPPGMYIAIAVVAICFIFIFLPDLPEDDEDETKKKKQRG
ncbi:signal peptidase I [Floccifex sp.]|uniref:signal peptidase I n=1 Tax=Floccifex sp. TaxID=2815810 RepID=UPI002A755AA5|nr:signal peptidase I [Floccifex sp.]MDY2957629.1 signal peptidase I [Floccifex sp.]